MSIPTILFLCTHGGGKSALAARFFLDQSAETNLTFNSDFAGIDPYTEMPQPVVAYLAAEGHNLSAHQPRLVTNEDLAAAHSIISVGCPLDGYELNESKLILWDDVPMLSDGFDVAAAKIRERVVALVASLQERDN